MFKLPRSPIEGWYFLTLIMLTALGAAMTRAILKIHKKSRTGERLGRRSRVLWFRVLAPVVGKRIPQWLSDAIRTERAMVSFYRYSDLPIIISNIGSAQPLIIRYSSASIKASDLGRTDSKKQSSRQYKFVLKS